MAELYHHGIKGQRWGIRRYQNLDGTLTPAGRERYGNPESGESNRTKIVNATYRYDDSGRSSKVSYRIKRELDNAFEVAKNAAGTNETGKAVEEAWSKHPRDKENIAKPWTWSKETIEAIKRDRKAWMIHDDYMSNMTMDIVNTMPEKERDAAMAYVFTLCNWD